MRNIWRDKEGFALSDNVVDDPIAFANAHLNITLKLVKVLLRIHQMKIVPRVRSLDDHYKEIASVVQILIAHWRLKFVRVLVDPFF